MASPQKRGWFPRLTVALVASILSVLYGTVGILLGVIWPTTGVLMLLAAVGHVWIGFASARSERHHAGSEQRSPWPARFVTGLSAFCLLLVGCLVLGGGPLLALASMYGEAFPPRSSDSGFPAAGPAEPTADATGIALLAGAAGLLGAAAWAGVAVAAGAEAPPPVAPGVPVEPTRWLCQSEAACSAPASARCDLNSGVCVPCLADTDCRHLGLARCVASACVACTLATETVDCGANSCVLNSCSETARGSRARCESCWGDSDCAAQLRCLPTGEGTLCMQAQGQCTNG